jgi:hypothetical protein
MTTKNTRIARAGLAGLAVLTGAGLLAGCAPGVGLAASMDPAPTGQQNPGCQQVGQRENGTAGWACQYAGSAATITVPANTTGMRLAMSGGQGGNSNPASGGYGTALSGTWAVTPGETMTVYVGQSANDATPGGGAAAGADAGCSAAGGGGGASSVQIDGAVAAVAAGGGGGGAQGIFPGADDGGAGGTSSQNGGAGYGGSGPGSGAGGLIGNGSEFSPAWRGGHGSDGGGCGGGGGGGWAGGNGGKAGGFGGGGGGGGGAGSDYTSPDAQAVTAAPANGGGDGVVSITWF